ncbi:MAG: PilW family protein [Gammaproteobacteria bacterium]
MNKFKHQCGMSLVEVLVALVISLFLIAGIVQVYIADKSSYAFSDSISRIQENGRFALDTMTQDLRMAGFFGCAIFDPADTSTIVNSLNPAGAGYDAALYDFIGQGLLEGTNGDGLNGSDSITLRGAKPDQVTIHPPYNVSTSAMLHVTTNDSIQPGDIVMISNCRGADIFQVTNTTNSTNASQIAVVHNTGAGSPGNYNPDACQGANAHCLSQTYGSDASLFVLQTVTYSIAVGASGEPALWRSENGVNVELIESIEQMQVLYGIDTDNDDFANQYVVSTAVTDMLDVMSIRLMLLVRSEFAFVTEEAQVYNYNGTNTTAADRRLRQVFSTTIALRNRVGA